MSRKTSLLVVAVVLIALVIAGATLAMITTNIEVTNVVTMGKVDVDYDLIKPATERNLVPGLPIAVKGVQVRNVGENAAWVRVKLENKGWQNVAGGNAGLITIEPSSVGDWEAGKDGYFYYKKKLEYGKATPVLNAAITLDGAGTTDSYAAKKLNVEYKVEAIQADHIDTYNQWPSGAEIQKLN